MDEKKTPQMDPQKKGQFDQGIKKAGTQPTEQPKKEGQNEGEGSKSADQNYRRDVGRFVENEDTEELGKQAKKDIEKDPQGYRDAEERGKKSVTGKDHEENFNKKV